MGLKKPLLACLLAPGLAMANDGIASVSAGGVVFGKTDKIAMKKEVLNVSRSLISVDYEFVNESSSEVEETIAFPLPMYPANEVGHEAYYGQPNGFSITVDGKPVAFRTVVVASVQGRPVTSDLREAGLSDAQIAFNPAFSSKTKVAPLTPKQVKQLTELGLMETDIGDVGRGWQVQVNYVWKQKFAANKVVRVHHAYVPFASGGPSEFGLEKAFCADDAFKKAWKRLAAENSYQGVISSSVGYILKTGNTWKNGIEDFTLNLKKRHPQELISLCFPGTFKKVDALTFQLKLKNFHPKEDLNVYFGNPDDHVDHEGVMPVVPR